MMKRIDEVANLLIEVQDLNEQFASIKKENEALLVSVNEREAERVKIEAELSSRYSEAERNIGEIRENIKESKKVNASLQKKLITAKEGVEKAKRAGDVEYRRKVEAEEKAAIERKAKEEDRENTCQEIKGLAKDIITACSDGGLTDGSKKVALENYKRATWIARNMNPSLSYDSETSKTLKQAKVLLDIVIPPPISHRENSKGIPMEYRDGNANSLQSELMKALGV